MPAARGPSPAADGTMRPRAPGSRSQSLLVLGIAPAAPRAVPLPTRLAQALAVPGNSPATSAAIAIDLRERRSPSSSATPTRRSSRRRTRSCTVTYAALVELGPTYRFRTEVLSPGYQDGRDLARRRLPEGLRRPDTHVARARDGSRRSSSAQGITRIDGRVLGDESWFDSQAHGARLEVVVLPVRVAAALGARRRPRRLRRSHRAAARPSPPRGDSGSSCARAGSPPAPVGVGRAPRRAYALAAGRVGGAARRCSRRWIATATTSRPSCC